MGYLEPTLHFLDNENSFFVCSRRKNIQVNLTDKQKQEVYELIEDLKFRNDRDFTSFQKEFLKLLVKYHLFSENDNSYKTSWTLPFKELESDPEFIQILHQNIPKEQVIINNDGTVLVNTNTDNEFILSVVVSSDNLYIFNKQRIPIHKVSEVVNPSYLKYAAIVLLEFLTSKDFSVDLFEHNILSIDLINFDNQRKYIPFTPINSHNFMESFLVNYFLTENLLELDHQSYFPLVKSSYKTKKGVYVAYGFTPEECIKNLLFILKKSVFDKSELIADPDFNMQNEPQRLSILNKVVALYFNENIEGIYQEIHHLKLVGRNQILVAEIDKIPGTLLISLYYSLFHVDYNEIREVTFLDI